MTQISGKTILITGGASGIGRQLALKAARQGARVVLWDVDQEATDRTLEELRQAGPEEPCGYQCNVADRDQVYAMAERVRHEIGHVDILINNAGFVSGKRFLDCTDEQIQRTIEVNTLAHFWTVKAFLPQMIEAGRPYRHHCFGGRRGRRGRTGRLLRQQMGRHWVERVVARGVEANGPQRQDYRCLPVFRQYGDVPRSSLASDVGCCRSWRKRSLPIGSFERFGATEPKSFCLGCRIRAGVASHAGVDGSTQSRTCWESTVP